MLPTRYTDVRPLGEGAFGQVYAATLGGAPVAVKVLAPGLADRPDVAWRFAAEWRTLARLAHPAFAKAVEEGRTDDGAPFYAMELVAGDEPAGPLPAADVRAVLAGLAEALAYLHGLGLVHGDLKPENLRLSLQSPPPPGGGEGQGGGAAAGPTVRVLDVGLVAPVGQRRDAIAGTLEYLAPEALRKAPVAPAADLYALGAIAWELWAGYPLFVGGPADLVRAHLTQAPPPPPNAGEDPALAALIAALLAKEPVARPPGARAVAALLAGEPVDAAAAPIGLQGGAFVGRAEALAAWRTALAVPGARLVLTGASGHGKTATLDALRLEATLAGRTWVGAAGGGAGDAPAAALRAVVAQALAAANYEPGPDLGAWLAGRMPPGLADLEPPARKVAIAAAAADALLACADALGGLAVGLDDWHRADEASRELAAHVARAAGGAEGDAAWDGPAIAWAIALDPEDPAGASGLGEGATTVALPPFDAAEARALLAARLGGEPPDALVETLQAAAGGRPALLDMLLEHLVATGALKATARPATDDQPAGVAWTLSTTGAGGALPASLEAAWAARLAGLAPDARRLAAIAAVAAPAGALPLPLLAAAAGLAPEPAAAALDALLAEGLLTAADGRARLAIPALAPALRGDLPDEEAAALATTLARGLVSAALGRAGTAGAHERPGADEGAAPTAAPGRPGAEGADVSDADLADHPPDALAGAAALATLGPDDALAARLAAAAGRASLALGAPAEALRWLDEAVARLDRLPAAPAAARLAARLPRAEALRLLDRLDDAISAYEAAIAATEAAPAPPATTDPTPSDPRAAAQAWIGLAKIRQMKGDYPAALDGYARATALGQPDQRARALAAESRVRAFRGEPEAALDAATRAEALARETGAEGILAQALIMRGYLEATADPTAVPTARGRLEEALAIGERLGDRAGVAMALDNLGNVLLAAGDLAGAAGVYARAVSHARSAGLATEALGAGLNQAIVAAERGDVAEAIATATDVARRADALGRKFIRAAALTAEAHARARRGDHEAARARLDEALAIAEGIGNKLLEEHVRVHDLEARLAAGDVAGAAPIAARAAELVAATGHAEMAARLAALTAERLRRAGDAEAALAEAAPHADAPNRVAAHLALRVLAELALAAGDHAAAEGHAQAALAIAEAWAAAWHEAADLALLARVAEARGQAADATALARRARERAGEANPAARAEAEAVLAAAGALAGPSTNGHGPAIALDAYGAWMAALAAARDEHEAGRTALDAAMSLTGADRGYLLAYHEGRLQKAISRGLDLAVEAADGFSQTMVQRAMIAGEPLYVADARTDATWQGAASVMALDLRTVVVLPLATPDALLGVLYMDRTAIDPLLGPPDLALLGALAATAASAVIRLRAQGDAEAGWGLLAALTGRLAPELPAGAAAAAVLAAAVEAAGAERGFWLVPMGDGGWDAAIALGADGAPIPYEAGAVSRGVADHVASTGQALTLLNAAEAEGWQARASVQALGLRTVWCLPSGAPDGAVLYLDTTDLAIADPTAALRGVEILLRYAGPLLTP